MVLAIAALFLILAGVEAFLRAFDPIYVTWHPSYYRYDQELGVVEKKVFII